MNIANGKITKTTIITNQNIKLKNPINLLI